MDAPRFDTLARLLGSALSRRALLPLLGSVLAAPLLGVAPAAAKKKKKKKTTLCLAGQTIQASKKKKKKLIKSGATPGACPSSPPPPPPPPPPPGCTAACEGKPCGVDDGCGGICGCAAGSLCHGGVCNACNVVCDGAGAACGDALQERLTGGGTVVACPGRYVRNFTLPSNVTLIGAGEGEDPATSTILDANGSGRVLVVNGGVTAALRGVRITGGNELENGGILNQGTLTVTACTVDANHSSGSFGGGIRNSGPLALNNCTVSKNTAATGGGGIWNDAGQTVTVKGSAITGNNAHNGGGVLNQGTVTFDSASSVTGNLVTGNGGGIYNQGTVVLGDATISGNTEPQCFGC